MKDEQNGYADGVGQDDREHRELTERIMDELEERQQEMEECDHEEIVRDEEQTRVDEHIWHCKECGMAFSPQKSELNLPEIEKTGHVTRLKISSDEPAASPTDADGEHELPTAAEIFYGDSKPRLVWPGSYPEAYVMREEGDTRLLDEYEKEELVRRSDAEDVKIEWYMAGIEEGEYEERERIADRLEELISDFSHTEYHPTQELKRVRQIKELAEELRDELDSEAENG